VVAIERFNQEEVYWEPHGTSPVRVATEEICVGVARTIINSIVSIFKRESIWKLRVNFGEGPHAVRRKEFLFVEDVPEGSCETFGGWNSQELKILGGFSALRAARVTHRGGVGDLFGENALIGHKPVEAFLKTWQSIERRAVEHLYSEKRDDAHERAHSQRNVSIIEFELVVIKSV
jgi:hypothetical protein